VLIERPAQPFVTEVDMGIWAQEIGGRAARRVRGAHQCTIAAYGSWERPDNGLADMVLATPAKGDAPDFEMPTGTRNDAGEVSSSGRPTSRNTPPAMAPFRTPDDDERARQTPSFRLWRSPPTVRQASLPQAGGLPLANRKTTLERSPDSSSAARRTACSYRVPRSNPRRNRNDEAPSRRR
jgi:hypothetical protein